MKRFFTRVLLFFAIIAIADVTFGSMFSYMVNHSKGGENYRDRLICDSVKPDILILGSSRALRHYNTNIISDSLGYSSFNCGQTGNGIILNYQYFQLVYHRHCPKYIIYDIFPSFDLLKNDNHKYLGHLKSFYDRPGVSEVFESVDEAEKYKMQSSLYRHNSRFLKEITGFIFPKKKYDKSGFWPIRSQGFNALKVKAPTVKEYYELDSLKLVYLNRLIDESHDTKLIFVVSPRYYGMDKGLLQPIYDVCQKKDIPLVDFSNDSKYVHKEQYFRDGNHLNNQGGADEFTRDLIKELKKRDLLN